MKWSADISKAIDTLSVRRGHWGVKGNASAWRPAFEKLNDQINHIKVSYKNRNQILKHTHPGTEREEHRQEICCQDPHTHTRAFSVSQLH